MAGNATFALTGTVLVQNAQSNLSQSSLITVAGTKRSDLQQDIDTTGEALNIGACASAGTLIAIVAAGTAGATVTFYRDAGFTQAISSAVAQGCLGLFLIGAPTIYAKASAGTVSVRVVAIEP